MLPVIPTMFSEKESTMIDPINPSTSRQDKEIRVHHDRARNAGVMKEEMVRVATGELVPAAVLATTMISLREFLRDYPVVLREIVTEAQNPDHHMGEISRQIAFSRGLMVDDALDEVSRTIIVAAVRGTGENLTLVSQEAKTPLTV
ncbi:MAG: hypothetical protein NVS2B16_11960 [Chloroflexota bacterium]